MNALPLRLGAVIASIALASALALSGASQAQLPPRVRKGQTVPPAAASRQEPALTRSGRADADYEKALAAFNHGDVRTALHIVDELERSFPQDARWTYASCLLRAQANTELDIAWAACERSIEFGTMGESSALMVEGAILLRQGRAQEALDKLNRAIDPQSSLCDQGDKVYLRGLSESRLGRSSEGQADIALARRCGGGRSYWENYGFVP